MTTHVLLTPLKNATVIQIKGMRPCVPKDCDLKITHQNRFPFSSLFNAQVQIPQPRMTNLAQFHSSLSKYYNFMNLSLEIQPLIALLLWTSYIFSALIFSCAALRIDFKFKRDNKYTNILQTKMWQRGLIQLLTQTQLKSNSY